MPEPRVLLFRDEGWESMPEALKLRVAAGVEKIQAQLTTIAEQARVESMPRVIVQPCVWHRGGHPVHASMCTLAALPGRPELGVVVSATVALCEDTNVIRSVLLHEVGHCFQTARKLIDQEDLGSPIDDLRGDPMDDARDRRLLPDMGEWFMAPTGQTITTGDTLDVPMAGIQELLDTGQLTLSDPPLMAPGKPVVPTDWVEHIRSLRRS